jgi:transcriptional regulator with XRE-family HTH domain
MNSYGVILVNIMKRNALSYREVSTKVGRSLGWLNQVIKGQRELTQAEFCEILNHLNIKNDPKRFASWVASSQRLTQHQVTSFDGAILKFLRQKKGLKLEQVSSKLEISISYLSKIENGQKPVSKTKRDQLLGLYGYSPSSFKNFNTKDKRAESIPPQFKLNILLQGMTQNQVTEVLNFANQLIQEK